MEVVNMVREKGGGRRAGEEAFVAGFPKQKF